jgi:hypothetical protein
MSSMVSLARVSVSWTPALSNLDGCWSFSGQNLRRIGAPATLAFRGVAVMGFASAGGSAASSASCEAILILLARSRLVTKVLCSVLLASHLLKVLVRALISFASSFGVQRPGIRGHLRGISICVISISRKTYRSVVWRNLCSSFIY